MTSMQIAKHIDKEQIAWLYFPEDEVLVTSKTLEKRGMELQKAAILSNADSINMHIVFEDSEGLKQVETGIWAVTSKRIILNDGATIPINRIHEIKI